MLEIKNLTKRYGGGTIGVDDLTLPIPQGDIFAILGTSGAGKTTLLQCIGRFLEPTSGQILLHEKDIWQMPREEFRKRLGIVFQHLNLFPHMTIIDNMILAPTVVYKEERSHVIQRAKSVLEQLSIPEIADSYPGQISGGQAQRVAIGRALLLEPDYLLLDEPTSALDINTTRALGEMILALRDKTTFIVVTHDLPFASHVAQKAVLMESGRITKEGTVDEISAQWTASES
ncbi:ATP-binding cassette domain-containing protein [bacterium]|nr:ATP-binding cassette domain-containing protein [bacterium]